MKKSTPPRLSPRKGAGRGASRIGRCTVEPSRVFHDLLPDLRESGNGFAWACCPFHNDTNPSFSVNLRTGWYRCFSTSCGQAGPSTVSFVSALLGLSYPDARRHTEARYGR